MQAWYDAEAGKLDPFVLVLEGSVPNEKINGDGYWTGMGVNPENGQPITTNEWIDRLAPKAAAVVAVGTCATYGGIPAMKNNPTGAMGLADYLGWNLKSKAGIPIVNIPGCPAQGDNITETLMYLVFALAGMAPLPELDEQLRPKWLFGRTVREGCNRAGFTEQGNFATEYGSDPALPGQARLQGPGGQVQRARARLDQRHRRLPERRRHLHGLHDAGLPRQVHAVHGPGPVGQRRRELPEVHLRARLPLHAQAQPREEVRQGARVASQPSGADHRLRRSGGEEPTWQLQRLRSRRRSPSRRCPGIR